MNGRDCSGGAAFPPVAGRARYARFRADSCAFGPRGGGPWPKGRSAAVRVGADDRPRRKRSHATRGVLPGETRAGRYGGPVTPPRPTASRSERGVALLSVQQAAERLGFLSRHVVRLVNAGSLEAGRVAGAGVGIAVAAVVAFERRRERGRAASDEFSRSLDALGAPLE
jgi:excisionase family DNA binding protein